MWIKGDYFPAIASSMYSCLSLQLVKVKHLCVPQGIRTNRSVYFPAVTTCCNRRAMVEELCCEDTLNDQKHKHEMADNSQHTFQPC